MAEPSKTDAKAIQQRLTDLGLLDPPPDGVLGSVSRWALGECGITEEVTSANADEILARLNAMDPWPLMRIVKKDARYKASGGAYKFMATVLPVDAVLGPAPPAAAIPAEDRPTLRKGDEGDDVVTVQECIMSPSEVDGDFGPKTDSAVRDYQRLKHLGVDGIVGQQTWTALYENFDLDLPPEPAVPPVPVSILTPTQQTEIRRIASRSAIADYDWDGRGCAPLGYVEGFALAWATVVMKYNAGDLPAFEMAKADTRNDDKDALSWYRSNFAALGMNNDTSIG